MSLKLAICCVVALVIVATSARTVEAVPAGPTDEPVTYLPPVTALVIDPFRPPDGPYGAGNRGLEYGTTPGTPVAVAADGVVRFAGPVAGDRWVTVEHADGIRTAYGPLATIDVAVGQEVTAGQPVGTTRDRLTFTARLGDTYLDPALLIAASPGSVRLVPDDEPARPAEPNGVLATGSLDRSWMERGVVWARRAGAKSAFAVANLAEALPVPSPLGLLAAGFRWWADPEPCSDASVQPVPPVERRVAIEVGGLGSTSAGAAVARLDTGRLGYDPGDTIRFSYRGGRVPGDAAPDLSAIGVTAYSVEDTLGDLRAAGHRLADLLVSVTDSVGPGVPVDVFAHSQGGLVTRLAVAELAWQAPATLDRLGLVVTLGTPHHGADLAGAVASLAASVPLELTLEAIQELVGLGIEPDAVAVRQLAPGSDVIRQLDADGLPASTHWLSVAARADPVVPAPRTRVTGATNIVVAVDGLNDHDALPSSAGAAREIGLALGGLPPTCEGLIDSVTDAAVGRSIQGLEGLFGVAARLGTAATGG